MPPLAHEACSAPRHHPHCCTLKKPFTVLHSLAQSKANNGALIAGNVAAEQARKFGCYYPKMTIDYLHVPSHHGNLVENRVAHRHFARIYGISQLAKEVANTVSLELFLSRIDVGSTVCPLLQS